MAKGAMPKGKGLMIIIGGPPPPKGGSKAPPIPALKPTAGPKKLAKKGIRAKGK
jgi:hypothetical protein